MEPMRRTQIYLEPELSMALDHLARQRGISRAGLIREAARQLLDREEAAYGSILGLAEIACDTATDVAECHDDYLIELMLQEIHR